jgi:sulfate adenylyltransferase subunit 2
MLFTNANRDRFNGYPSLTTGDGAVNFRRRIAFCRSARSDLVPSSPAHPSSSFSIVSDSLHQLEQHSIYVIREAFARVKPLAMLWSLGKDSNTLLWLVRKAFQGRVPFPVVLLDTGNEFPEVYAFRDRYVREWNLNYINAPCPPVEEADPTLPPNARAAARKTLGLRRLIAERGLQGMLLGIRRDEQGIRGKERAMSPRDANGGWHVRIQPTELWGHYGTAVPPGGHLRVHPLLEWTELDIWRYVEREGIPVCELYFARGGKRYRSLGEADITFPVDSNAASIGEIIRELETTRQEERAGRAMDNEREDAFERLRAAGYM